MAFTGYLINVFMDANPYSETYGQERTERVLDTNECPTQQPANYVQVYTYCEMLPNGAYTGNCVIVYEDVEPMSATYGQQMEEVYTDGVLCPPDSEQADWQQVDQYCEQIAYQPSGKLGNSGYIITVFQDMASFSPTYGDTRETREQDVVHCTPPDTSDIWVEIGTECELENGVRTGNKITYRVEVNEYSPNYNFGQTETLIERDLLTCPRSAQAPDWELQSATCEYDNYGYATGYIINTYVDDNRLSQTYGQTKTERVLDETSCPPEQQNMVMWRIINNRSAGTDTITSVTIHMDYNYDIAVTGSIPPAGGTLSGSTVIPKILVTAQAQLVTQSVDVSPNTSMPTIYQFSQTPNPYVYNAATTLIITLWDGDGTGPMWTEVSYVCETVDGYRTGASTVTEEDLNPDSATYGQTRTRVIEYDERCPAQTDADWVETSWSCETENGYNTGNRLSVQTDQNPNSSTYGSTRVRIIYDTENCPLDTTAAWTVVSSVCEQQDGLNTGNIIVTERDVNPGSATYNETRVRTYEDTTSCPINSEAIWVEESYYCEQEPSTLNFKLWYSTSATTATVPCDNNSHLDNSELSLDMVKVTIGACVTHIDDYAFDFSWMSISPVPIPKLVSISMANSVISIGVDAFWNCRNLETINLSNNLQVIDDLAFDWCRSLTTITIPSSILSIGRFAFQGCTNLQSITIEATTPPTLGENAFVSTTDYPIYVPAASVSAYKTATNWSTYASRIFAIPS